MLINGTGRLFEVATCRECGARGLEDPAIDPAPGLCPACFEKRLDADIEEWAREMAVDIVDLPLDQAKRAAGDPELPGFAPTPRPAGAGGDGRTEAGR